MGRLEGRTAVVTGGASGIGRATVERFLAEGATVESWDLSAHDAPGATTRVVDVTEEAQVAAGFAAARTDHGGVDAVVHAAGIASGGPVHLLDEAEWARVISVNLTGTFLVDKHAAAVMLEQAPRFGVDGAQRGSIVNLASVEGLIGTEGGSAYNASKGGVVILTKNLAIDYGRRGIRVNAICPGFIDTPLLSGVFGLPGMEEVVADIARAHQFGRLGRAEEIASVWSSSSPREAAAWAAGLPEAGEVQRSAVRNVAEHWLRIDSMEAGKWILQLPEGATRDAAAERVVRTTVRSDPAVAFEWANSLSDEGHRSGLIRDVVRGWSAVDAASARAALGKANLSPQQLREISVQNGLPPP